jgi:hypothetical protein
MRMERELRTMRWLKRILGKVMMMRLRGMKKILRR